MIIPPTFDDVFAVMASASVGNIATRVMVSNDASSEHLPTKFAIALNRLLDDLDLRAAEVKQTAEALRLSRDHAHELETLVGERALQDSEERFRRLVASVKDYSILLLDPHGLVASWNEGSERMKGYRAHEILGQHFSRFYPAEDIADGKPERELAAAVAHGRSEDEGWRVRKDGSRFWANVVITPVHDENGKLCGFAKVASDFTLRRSAEEELKRANRAKTDFLAMMSHELRTPLNSIIGFSEVMIDGKYGDLSERHQRYLKNIYSSGKHLLGLINDLLDLSKVEAGRLEIALRPCWPYLLLAEAMATLQPVADAAKVKLLVDSGAASSSEAVTADPVRFKQVLYNLLSNAIKFTPPEGQIIVRTEALTSHVRVSVTDAGLGISEDDLPRLFTPFTQLGNAKEKSGTGLGLALSKNLVELMGGRIGVESIAGKGATFFFELPRVENTPVSEPLVAWQPGTDGPLILIVDDDRDAQELLQLALHGNGFRTMVASTGEEALKLARLHRPQVITLDVFLPTIDGWDVLRVLRNDADTADIPIVMVTMSSDRRTAFALGAVEHLVKPIDQKSLLAVLRRLGFATKVMERPVLILVVDDDPQQLELARAALEPHGFVVYTELTGRAGIVVALSTPIDLLLLDLVMPDISGIEVIDVLRKNGSTIPIILITGHDITLTVSARLKGDVEAILAKGVVSPARLVEQVNSVLRVSK